VNKKLALVQSNYIPWKGYFDLINLVDEFVLFDDVQYTRRDWRNRNRIKTSNGVIWLTIPVDVKGKYFQNINETVINDPDWSHLHWKTITHSYSKAAFFHEYRERFENLYLGSTDRYLSQINHRFIVSICEMLGITTKIAWSMDYNLQPGKTERIVDLCAQAGATEYVSGPAAKAYMQENLFRAKGIAVSYIDYSGYPEYRQLYPPFEHRVSIIDLILNEGPNAPKYMKSF
jgi:WbqC-like protein family